MPANGPGTALQRFIVHLADTCLSTDWQLASLRELLVTALKQQPAVPVLDDEPEQRPPVHEQALPSLDGRLASWLDSWLARLFQQFPNTPDRATLLNWCQRDELLAQSWYEHQPRFYRFPLVNTDRAVPVAGVPALADSAALARWLGLGLQELAWLANSGKWRFHSDQREALAQGHNHGHYRALWIAKRSGGYRLLEIPKPQLKHVQQKINQQLLKHLPLHDAAYGFRPGRNRRQHAVLHQGQATVLKFDLSDCFLHVSSLAVYQAFRQLGLNSAVARILQALSMQRWPSAVTRQWMVHTPTIAKTTLAQVEQLHLPQGAPSSPMLANYALTRVDQRLAAYARHLGGCYSRYADDLVISGDARLARRFRAIETRVAAIVLEEGFVLNLRKSRCLAQSQRQLVTGVVVNDGVNPPRKAFKALKAQLYNCVQQGWQTQTRLDQQTYQAHLLGRISSMAELNPDKGSKLMMLYQQICW